MALGWLKWEHDLIRPQILKEGTKKEERSGGNWPQSGGFKVISAQRSFAFLLKPPGEHPKEMILPCTTSKAAFVL